MKHDRKQLFVDPRLQGAALVRTLLYWSLCVLLMGLTLLVGRLMAGPSRDVDAHLDYLWFHYKWIAIAAVAMLPIILIDSLRLTNRFAGPILRLQRGLGRLADGDLNVPPLRLRDGDFCKDVAESFNRMLERLQEEANSQTAGPQEASDDAQRDMAPAEHPVASGG